MMYGITYLYRASDFFGVVEKFHPECVLFTPFWTEIYAGGMGGNRDSSDLWKIADCYEFSFMGPFGMGYKLLVLGEQRNLFTINRLDNKALWATANDVRKHGLEMWRKKKFKGLSPHPSIRSIERELIIRPGYLVSLEVVESAFVGVGSFLENKIPESVPFVIRKVSG